MLSPGRWTRRGLLTLLILLWPTMYWITTPAGVFAQTRAPLVTRDVTMTTSDGVVISGVYRPGKKSGPAVLLLHMVGRTAEDWKYMAENFQRNGYHVLAIDLRGHGKSIRQGDKTLDFQSFTDDDYQKMSEDVAAAVTWLRGQADVDGDKVAIVGASIGANLGLKYAAGDARISHVAMLSPGLEYKGVEIEGAIQQYGDRPIFLAVSREDNYSAKSVLVLEATSTSQRKEMRIFTGAGHGTKMLSREPGLESTLLAWLNGTLASGDNVGLTAGPPTSPPSAPPRPPAP